MKLKIAKYDDPFDIFAKKESILNWSESVIKRISLVTSRLFEEDLVWL